jgi:hypothetical protein
MIVDFTFIPTNQNVENVTRYLERFVQPGFTFEEGEDDWGETIYSDEAIQFIQDLHNNGFIVNYEWPDWHEQAVKYENNESMLQSAELDELRKLLTYHVRKDRFSGGHLRYVFKTGLITSILHRLEQLNELNGTNES